MSYREIEMLIASKYGVQADGTKKSIGDFLLGNDKAMPVNVKSNNVDKKNYSPNIISAKRLINWLSNEDNKLFFVFVDYKNKDGELKIEKSTELIPVEHLSWECLSIQAQGWGVIQMSKALVVNKNQTKAEFMQGLKIAYKDYVTKQEAKMKKISEIINNL